MRPISTEKIVETMEKDEAAVFLAYQAGAEHGEVDAWAGKMLYDKKEAMRAYETACTRVTMYDRSKGRRMSRLRLARDLLTK